MTGHLSQEAGEATFLETDILREQDLQACEITYQKLLENNEEALRWFTVQILKCSERDMPMVALALLDQDKDGTLRWKTARKPLALLRHIAFRTARKWSRPRTNSREKLMTDTVGTSEYSYRDAIDRLIHRRIGDEEYAEWWDLDETLIIDNIQIIQSPDGQFYRIGLLYSWQEIGRRMEWDADQTTMFEARAHGVTRLAMPRHLGWTRRKCETVWRRSSRSISQSAMKARTRLLRDTESATQSSAESDT